MSNPENPWDLLSAYWVDPINGSDSTAGGSPLDALRTTAEIGRRLRNQVIQQSVTVTVLSDCPAGDVLDLVGLFLNPGVTLTIQGTLTQTRSGTFTAGLIAENAAVNQELVIEDTAMAPGQWTADKGRLVKVTSGANAGSSFWVSHDQGGVLGTGSHPSGALSSTYNAVASTGVANGDPYAVYSLSRINLGRVSVDGAAGNSTGTNGVLLFQECAVNNPTGAQQFSVEATNQAVVFHRCKFVNNVGSLAGSNNFALYFWNCWSTFALGAPGLYPTYGAGVLAGLSGLLSATCVPGGTLTLTTGIYCLAPLASGSGSLPSSFPNARINVTGLGAAVLYTTDGVQLGGTAELNVLGSARLWGSHNSGVGLSVRGKSRVIWDTNAPQVTGAGGDIKYQSNSTAMPFDPVNRVFAAAINTTYANLVAAFPGFGNFIDNPGGPTIAKNV